MQKTNWQQMMSDKIFYCNDCGAAETENETQVCEFCADEVQQLEFETADDYADAMATVRDIYPAH